MRTLFFYFFLSIQLFVELISCKKSGTDGGGTGGGQTGNGIPVTSVSLNLNSSVLVRNGTRQFIVTLTPSNATDRRVTWSSSNNAVATVDTTGLVTAISEGSCVITVTSQSNNSLRATATITVLHNYDLYIAGNAAVYSSNYFPPDYYSCFWRNGAMTTVTGGYDVGRSARAITVVGNDVYLAGLTANANLWYVPTLWMNGTPTYLSATNNDYMHYANSISVAGGNVYVAGYLYNTLVNPSTFTASLWKINNNIVTPVSLPIGNGMNQSDAFGVAANSSDVYTSGSISNNFYSIASYWKNNGSPVLLSAANNWGKAKAIALSGNDVYVAGYEGCPNFGCTMTFKLWKNDGTAPVILGSINSTQFEITGISISGPDIYICGYVANSSNTYIATLWKVNGNTVTTIPLSDGARSAVVNGIMASGNDVFAVGYEVYLDNNNIQVPKAHYWRVYNSSLVESFEFKNPEYQLPQSNMTRAYGVYIR